VRQAYEPGEVLCDEYVVRLLLGQGRMGEVYLVEHSASGDLRAATVMRVGSNATDADLVGFRQEALSLLNAGTHPFVVRLFDVREQARDTVLMMEYVAPVSGCTTVASLIPRTQLITRAQAQPICKRRNTIGPLRTCVVLSNFFPSSRSP
jgi:Protein kinase domain